MSTMNQSDAESMKVWGTKDDGSPRTCQVCGGVPDAIWIGADHIMVCRRCAVDVLPKLIADALNPAKHPGPCFGRQGQRRKKTSGVRWWYHFPMQQKRGKREEADMNADLQQTSAERAHSLISGTPESIIAARAEAQAAIRHAELLAAIAGITRVLRDLLESIHGATIRGRPKYEGMLS